MKRISKKIISIILTTILLTSLNICVSASAQEDITPVATKEATIIDQALSLDKTGNLEGCDFHIVSLNSEESSIYAHNDVIDKSSQAIQAVNTKEDGSVDVITILPYKCLPSGKLENSFDYAPAQTRDMSTDVTNLVDGTITVVTHYAVYARDMGVIKFYRHAGIEAYWNSNNSTMSVSNMYVNYGSAGELHKYPECLTENSSATLVQSYYSIESTINQNNPVKGQLYLDGTHTMPINRVLKPTNYMEHGGLVYVKVTYTVNGTSHVDDRSYFLY